MFFLPSFRAACQGQCGSLVDVSQGQKSDPSRSSLSFSEGGAPTDVYNNRKAEQKYTQRGGIIHKARFAAVIWFASCFSFVFSPLPHFVFSSSRTLLFSPHSHPLYHRHRLSSCPLPSGLLTLTLDLLSSFAPLMTSAHPR